jgi:hypothetical protein
VHRVRSGGRSRTPILGTKTRCPAVGRPPTGVTVPLTPPWLAEARTLATLRPDMGSLIKKRRKRMRKKKHKKMLKRTRFQRRAKK